MQTIFSPLSVAAIRDMSDEELSEALAALDDVRPEFEADLVRDEMYERGL